MFCCTLLYVPSSFAIILMGKRELVVLLSLTFWCLVIVVWILFTMQQVCLLFVVVIFSDHTHYFWPIVAMENANNFIEIVVPIFKKNVNRGPAINYYCSYYSQS